MKTLINILVVLVVIFFEPGCKKKVPTYYISETTKGYFSFQKGSYWIYKNDSTGNIDSANVKYFSDFFYGVYNENHDISREIILVGFNSIFLFEFTLLGYACTGPNEVTVASRDNDTSQYASGGPPMYSPSLFSNTVLLHPTCLEAEAIELSHMQNITVNNIQYTDIIRSKVYSLDSTSTYPFYLLREMYFAKNIGIVKFFEIDKSRNLSRSWSLLRHKSIQ
jgi:hypothetical protein